MNTLMSFAAPLFNQKPHHDDDHEVHHNLDDHEDDNQRKQPQSQKQMNSKAKTKKSLSLENYLAFLHSRDSSFFTVDNIRKIMSIHGFKKGREKRKEVEEAVAAMELIAPARSTLNEKVSPEAFMTVKEAIMDLQTLNWKECSITSIKSISSLNKDAANPFKPITKPATRKTKKRSASALSKAFSVSSEVFESGLKESDSVSGSSSLTLKPIQVPMLALSATSSSNNTDGLELLSLAAEAGKDGGAEKKQSSKKRRSIKRVLLG